MFLAVSFGLLWGVWGAVFSIARVESVAAWSFLCAVGTVMAVVAVAILA